LALAEHGDISVPSIQSPFSQQKDAIEAIVKVVQGHRKRPLVLTADRGRGKTAALGKAAAKLLQIRPLSILVTAPNAKSIEPLFRHLAIDLGVTYSQNSCAFNGGSITFIAPDELLSGLPQCDLLLVDEAGALPLPTLMALTQNYHRMVFSTTVHGYEGCGRGFTLKFNKWLSENRPGFASMHLQQPIRWAEDDPVEQWLFDSFLFNAEISQHMSVDISTIKYEVISATRLFETPELLNQAVALLVNAHYQTSPNDILQILDNPQLCLLMAHANKQCLGVVLFVHEEALAPSVIDAVQLGKARPKGQLFSTYIANHLGFREAASASSYRIMRITVHPVLQRKGIGRRLLEHVEQIAVSEKAYVATSFGLTSDVLSFWISNKFIPLSFGTRKDAASGTYSLFLAKPLNESQHEWIKSASMTASLQVKSLLSSVYQPLGFTELATLLKAYSRNDTVPTLSKQQAQQLLNFSQGGNALYSVKASLESLVLLSIHYLAPSPLLIDLVLKQKPHKVIISEHHFSGKNELELKVRAEVSTLLADLQCKFSI
jgi:tRNA(Met) cytidine acetyltransferase